MGYATVILEFLFIKSSVGVVDRIVDRQTPGNGPTVISVRVKVTAAFCAVLLIPLITFLLSAALLLIVIVVISLLVLFTFECVVIEGI